MVSLFYISSNCLAAFQKTSSQIPVVWSAGHFREGRGAEDTPPHWHGSVSRARWVLVQLLHRLQSQRSLLPPRRAQPAPGRHHLVWLAWLHLLPETGGDENPPGRLPALKGGLLRAGLVNQRPSEVGRGRRRRARAAGGHVRKRACELRGEGRSLRDTMQSCVARTGRETG